MCSLKEADIKIQHPKALPKFGLYAGLFYFLFFKPLSQ